VALMSPAGSLDFLAVAARFLGGLLAAAGFLAAGAFAFAAAAALGFAADGRPAAAAIPLLPVRFGKFNFTVPGSGIAELVLAADELSGDGG
jgi:hypothetical protein